MEVRVAPKFILGKKKGMAQVFTEEGERVPVTVIAAGPCPVIQVKNTSVDGYSALQLGFSPQKEQRMTKPQLGHFKKAGVDPHHYLREVRLDEDSADVNVGDVVSCDVFEEGDTVDITGKSKGHGFQGTVRAWNFKGKRETHGNMNQRGPGSIGMHSYPARVLKGKKMATHWGDERVTARNLTIVAVDKENNEILVRGSVPGAKDGLLIIRRAKAAGAK